MANNKSSNIKYGKNSVGNYYVENGKRTYYSQPKIQRKSTNTSSSSRSTRGSSSSSGGLDAYQLAYLQAQQQALEEQRRRAEELAAQRQQLAQQAYDRNKAGYEAAFGERQDTLKKNLDTTLGNLKADYDSSSGTINKNSENSMREAYINYMNSQKNLAQNLAAQGISGGAAESTMAGLENNYGASRNNIATTTEDNLSELERLYNTNRNGAYTNYNDRIASDSLAKAQYMTQLENDLAAAVAQAYTDKINSLANIDDNYYGVMAQLTAAQQAYTPTAVAAGNTPQRVSTNQSSEQSKGGNLTGNYPKFALRLAQEIQNNGGSAEEIMRRLAANSVSSNGIASILAQLGYAK